MMEDIELYQSILASWDRCTRRKMLREIEKPLILLSSVELSAKLKENKKLVHEFENFMLKYIDIINNVKGDYCILLLDREGYLLSVRNCIKHFDNRRKYKDFFMPGISFAEDSLGINAVALSQLLRKSVYMYPLFHYCAMLKVFHQYCAYIGSANDSSKGYVSVVNIRNPISKALEGFIDILAVNLQDKPFLSENSIDFYDSQTKLTKKQNTIIRLIAQGFTDESIAQELKISLSTVKYHNQNIFKKLDVTCRAEAVTKALIFNEILFSELRNL